MRNPSKKNIQASDPIEWYNGNVYLTLFHLNLQLKEGRDMRLKKFYV